MALNTEKSLESIFTKALDLSLTSIKTLLTRKYEEEFEISSISLDPGNENLLFSAYSISNDRLIFSGKIMKDGRLADDYLTRIVFLPLENDITASFAESNIPASVHVSTTCVVNVTNQDKGCHYLEFMKKYKYADIFFRALLLNRTIQSVQLEKKTKEIVRDLGIDIDVSAYLYSFTSEEAFTRCKEEIFSRPRFSNDYIEQYLPTLITPIWIDKEV